MNRNVPSHWKRMAFREVAEVVTGSTPSTKQEEYFGGAVPFVTPTELNGGIPVSKTPVTLTEIGAKQVRVIPENSVMVCCIGSLGKIGIAGTRLATNQQINSLVFDEKIVDPRYGFHYCQTLKPLLIHLAPSTTVPIINKGRFQELEIPLPPLPEQKRIAAILDKVDSIRRKRQEMVRLTEDLLRSVFLDMFGDPVMNPKGWKEASLQHVAEIVSGVTKGRKLDGKQTILAPYLRVANVQDGYLNLDEIKEIEVLQSDIEKYRLLDGDILLTEGGDPDKLGRGTVWREHIEDCIHQNHIFRVRIKTEKLLPDFLSVLIGSERGKRYFIRAAKQTTGIASINSKQLKNFSVLIPPLDSQQRFAKKIAILKKIKMLLADNVRMIDTLFNSISQAAFMGKLA